MPHSLYLSDRFALRGTRADRVASCECPNLLNLLNLLTLQTLPPLLPLPIYLATLPLDHDLTALPSPLALLSTTMRIGAVWTSLV